MKRILALLFCLTLTTLICGPPPEFEPVSVLGQSYTETFYICGGGNGSLPETATCATAYDAADFNTVGNWDIDDQDDGLIGPNDAVWIMDDGGDIRSQLTVQQDGLPGKPITIGAESGDTPVVNGSDLLTGWTSETNGFTSYYVGASNDPGQVFEDDARMSLAASKAALTPGDYWWDSGNSRIYVRTTGDDDPSGYTMEGTRGGGGDWGILVKDRDYVTIQDIVIDKARYGIGWHTSGSNGIIDNVTVQYSSLVGMKLGENGTVMSDFLVKNSTFIWNKYHGLEASHETDNLTVQDCLFHDNAHPDAGDWSAGLKYVASDVTRADNVTFQRNVSYNHGIGATGARGHGIWADGPGLGWIIKANRTYDNRLSGIQGERPGANSDLEIIHNISYSNGEGIKLSREAHNVVIANNTLYANTVNITIQGLWNGGDPVGMDDNVIKNNIAFGGTTNLQAVFGADNDGVDGAGNIYTYNCFGPESSNFIEWGRLVYYSTYDTWQAAVGCGVGVCDNQVEADALLVDGANDNFALQYGSPAIDAGVNLGATYDDALLPGSTWPDGVLTVDQDAYGAGWEIGAYAYTLIGTRRRR